MSYTNDAMCNNTLQGIYKLIVCVKCYVPIVYTACNNVTANICIDNEHGYRAGMMVSKELSG